MSEFTADGTDRTTTLKLSGLTCDHCVAHVTEELKALDGVKNVSVVLHKGGQSVATVVSDVLLDDDALSNQRWMRRSNILLSVAFIGIKRDLEQIET